MKGYKIKRLQKIHTRKFKRKILDDQRLQNISQSEDNFFHSEELPHKQNDNHLMLQYEDRVAPEDDESPKRYINAEHEVEEGDDNVINKSVPNLKKKILDDVQKMKDDQWLRRIR